MVQVCWLLLPLLPLTAASLQEELQGREIVSPLYILNELEEPQDIRRRAWNSGFHTGMGKRYGNRELISNTTIFGSRPETLTLEVKRYIDWLTGYPGKGR